MIRVGDIVDYYWAGNTHPLAAIVAKVHESEAWEFRPGPAAMTPSGRATKDAGITVALCVVLEDGTTTNRKRVSVIGRDDKQPVGSMYCTERPTLTEVYKAWEKFVETTAAPFEPLYRQKLFERWIIKHITT